MKNGNLFHHEEQVLNKALEIQESPPDTPQELLDAFKELAREYGKLSRQSKSLVNISDMMQKDLNILNERVNVANKEIKHKNEQLEEFSRRLSEALESSQQKYRDIFDNAVEGIFRISPDGTILEANPAFAQILGFSGVEQLVQELPSLESAAMSKGLRSQLLHEFAWKDTVSSLRMELHRRDGSSFVASVSARAVRDRKGNIAYCEGLLADVTQRENVERAERERRAAEAASMAKSHFLAKMSHEIRTPMNAIIGLTENLLRTNLDEQQLEHLTMVQDSGEHLLEIINDILDFAKLESGRVRLERIDFDLARLLQGCLAAMRAAAVRKDLTMTLRIAPDVPTFLRGDPGRLRQVINNLLSNAVKFTDNGVVELAVMLDTSETEQLPDDALNLLFSVKDTGMGIEPENHERIFQDFTQSDDSTFRQFGGTGLGLSICRELVELMQGRIWVTSALGLGSKFSFTGVFAPGDPIAAKVEDVEPAESTRPLRVLVVEDSPVNRTVTRLHLKGLGHSILEAEDGLQALEILAKNPDVDLVLMDLEMPQMDGLDTVKRIRKGAEGVINKNVPVIAMTAHAFVEARESCLAAGMDGYISKPIKRADLARVIEEVIVGDTPVSSPPQLVAAAAHRLAPPQAEKQPILDTETARHSQGLTREEFSVLFAAARKELQHELEMLRKALKHSDREQMSRSAHTLKTVAASIGAMQCSKSARHLEALTRNSDGPLPKELLEQLQTDLQQLEQEIEKGAAGT